MEIRCAKYKKKTDASQVGSQRYHRDHLSWKFKGLLIIYHDSLRKIPKGFDLNAKMWFLNEHPQDPFSDIIHVTFWIWTRQQTQLLEKEVALKCWMYLDCGRSPENPEGPQRDPPPPPLHHRAALLWDPQPDMQIIHDGLILPLRMHLLLDSWWIHCIFSIGSQTVRWTRATLRLKLIKLKPTASPSSLFSYWNRGHSGGMLFISAWAAWVITACHGATLMRSAAAPPALTTNIYVN